MRPGLRRGLRRKRRRCAVVSTVRSMAGVCLQRLRLRRRRRLFPVFSGTGRLFAEMASTALSARMTMFGVLLSQGIQKPPFAFRDPGAMALKGLSPLRCTVPRISAPVLCPLAFRQTKTALRLWSAWIRPCCRQASSSFGSQGAGLGEGVADVGPCAVACLRHAEGLGGVSGGCGGVDGLAVLLSGMASQEADCVARRALPCMDDEVDGAACAFALEMIVELCAGDGDDRSCAFEARAVCVVLSVAQHDGDAFEGDCAQRGEWVADGHRGCNEQKASWEGKLSGLPFQAPSANRAGCPASSRAQSRGAGSARR